MASVDLGLSSQHGTEVTVPVQADTFSMQYFGGLLECAQPGDRIVDLFFGHTHIAAAFVHAVRSFTASTMQDQEDCVADLRAGPEKLPIHRTVQRITIGNGDGAKEIESVILRHSASLSVNGIFDPKMTVGQLQEELSGNMRNLL